MLIARHLRRRYAFDITLPCQQGGEDEARGAALLPRTLRRHAAAAA